MGILCAVFAVASIRTNVVLFTILVILVPCCTLPDTPATRFVADRFSLQSAASLPPSSLLQMASLLKRSHTNTLALRSFSLYPCWAGTSS